MHRTFPALALTALLAGACASTAPLAAEDSPWAPISPDSQYSLGEGASVLGSRDDEPAFEVRVAGGRLLLDGRDIGPCDASRVVRFLADGRLTVDGETRATRTAPR